MFKATIDYQAAGRMWLAWQCGRELGTEVSGVAILTPDKTIKDAQVLLQTATGAETELDADALFDWFLQNENAFRAGNVPVHWHTHPEGLGPKPSAGDRKQYQAWQSQFDRFLAIIIDGTDYALYPHTGLDWPGEGKGDIVNYHLPTTDAHTYADYWLPECYGAWFNEDPDMVKDAAEEIFTLVKKPPPLPKTISQTSLLGGSGKPVSSVNNANLPRSSNVSVIGSKDNQPIHSMTDDEYIDYVHTGYAEPTYRGYGSYYNSGVDQYGY